MRAMVTTVLELLGMGAIVAGVALWSLQAALIVAGVALLTLAWRSA